MLLHMATTMYIALIAIYVLPAASLITPVPQPRQEDGVRVATLIAMDIRLPKEQQSRNEKMQLLNAITSGTDVFICTDERYAHDLGDFSNVAHVWLSNTSRREGVANSTEGQNTIQWLRLQECWDSVQSYERWNRHHYSFIVKLRTDCDKNRRFQCLQYAANREILNNVPDGTAFIYSDLQFGAGRKVFSRIASLYSRISSDYWKRDTEYVNVDWGLLPKCDMSAGKFSWLAYPEAAMGEPPCFSSECISRNNRLLDWSHTHSDQDARPTNVVSEKKWGNPGVSSEKILVLDLLRDGVIIQHFNSFSLDTREGTLESVSTGDCIDDSIDGDCPAYMY